MVVKNINYIKNKKITLNGLNDNLLYVGMLESDKILDFHLIHVFLNMGAISRYENARECFQNFSQLKRHVN